jgi:hypothetical protein
MQKHFAGFNDIYTDSTVREAACMAPARRKVRELHDRHPTATTIETTVSLGRNNYLFMGANSGGERAAQCTPSSAHASSAVSIPRRICVTS